MSHWWLHSSSLHRIPATYLPRPHQCFHELLFTVKAKLANVPRGDVVWPMQKGICSVQGLPGAQNASISALIPAASIATTHQQIYELLRRNHAHKTALYKSSLRWKLFGLETASYYRWLEIPALGTWSIKSIPEERNSRFISLGSSSICGRLMTMLSAVNSCEF